MTSTKKTTRKAKTLNLSGDLTISRGDEILSQLRDALEKNSNVHISIKGATAIDLPFLQLLCSAHRTAAKEKKTIDLEHSDAEMFFQVIKQAGFKRRNGCSYSPDGTCLCSDGGK